MDLEAMIALVRQELKETYSVVEEAKADLKTFVRQSYEWAKSPEAGMSVLTGFVPETANPHRTSEGCAVADMIALALKLSAAGAAIIMKTPNAGPATTSLKSS
jgi:hypothetical protein